MGDVLIFPIVGRQVQGKRIPKPKPCAECEEPIETARLQLVPHARRCVQCETERAKRHQRCLSGVGEHDIVIIKG